MKIIDILEEKKRGFSFEFFPPKTSKAKESFKKTVQILKRYKPLYVSMTYGASGSSQEYTKEATYLLLSVKEFTVIPHLTCVGATAFSIRKLLDEYKLKGIENIMALRGDPPKDKQFDFKKTQFPYAKDLVRFIKKNYNFCIGVALYPEGHIEEPSFDRHLQHMKQKIDAGADFAVTQMFFDNSYFYSFLEKAKKAGISIPILPGILPLYNILKAKEFCLACKATIPKKIQEKMSSFLDKPEEMEKIGIDFTIKQCKDLIEKGYQRIHFFTLNRPRVMVKLLDALKNF
ncbi:MAG: methylenetetrahydrofolate reductase [NAD(P)H] [Candidatus Omnitrophica bacterium]|nr:methylenetetrahydrofolate reductase [NAD(P)H] [Candidatus Omnitrophota bacterium]